MRLIQPNGPIRLKWGWQWSLYWLCQPHRRAIWAELFTLDTPITPCNPFKRRRALKMRRPPPPPPQGWWLERTLTSSFSAFLFLLTLVALHVRFNRIAQIHYPFGNQRHPVVKTSHTLIVLGRGRSFLRCNLTSSTIVFFSISLLWAYTFWKIWPILRKGGRESVYGPKLWSKSGIWVPSS